MALNQIIDISLFDEEIGRIGFDENQGKSSFQYNPAFLAKENLSAIIPETGVISRIKQVQVFTTFNSESFKGIPPQFADSLPDMFGSIIFKAWMEAREQSDINVLEQLAYVGNRGMGAFEYAPIKRIPEHSPIDLEEVILVLKQVLNLKNSRKKNTLNSKALINIFKIGTSAGGARPKILVSEKKESGDTIPGDINFSNDYHHYLIKLALDEDNYPREIVEYCYYLIAKKLGIDMMGSKLVDQKHFATLRFDRQNGQKQHALTASGLTGWDFKSLENSTYENLFKLASFLKVPNAQIEQLFKRMVFNVVFHNTDDHLKNHSFIYHKETNRWNLAPAYDMTYALNPLIDFKKTTRALSINNKRHDIKLPDLLSLAHTYTIKNPEEIIREVQVGITILFNLLRDHDIPKAIREGIQKKIKPIK